MASVNYPPENIYNHSNLKKPDYDHIILWMLSNNKTCKWSDFHQDPVEIPTGTLSRHLDQLKRKGLIENFTRGYYRITAEGKRKFNELSSADNKIRRLNYPPNIILKSGRNYSHWILWMVYNNNYCKRSNFLEDPLSINQSSLSKNLSLLIEEGYIQKEEGKYIITHRGKSEYSRMLRNYDLDRQTILEEESKRIEDNTQKTIQFFEQYSIKDKDTQFRFLDYFLKLDFEKVRPILKDEEAFRKILLFLSFNHPDEYPYYIYSGDFCKTYNIKKTTLDYYVDEIAEGKIYPIRFFKLKESSGKQYYFQSSGTLEKMLQVITENLITKTTYLEKLFADDNSKTNTMDMSSIINDIAEKSCESLFNKELKDSLIEFLPEYIKYLAYKIETKGQLKESYDKLEGIVWMNISEILESQIPDKTESRYEEKIKEINNQIKLEPNNLDIYYLKIRTLIYYNQYQEAINLLDQLLGKFPENEKDIKILNAVVLRRTRNIKAGLDIINELLKTYQEDNDLICYKAYWLQYLDEKEESLKLIQSLIKLEPENGMYLDAYGEILMYFEEYEEAAKKFLKAIVLGNDDWYLYQTYIKLGICYKALENYNLAIKNLRKGKELTKKTISDPEAKQKWLKITELFLSEMES